MSNDVGLTGIAREIFAATLAECAIPAAMRARMKSGDGYRFRLREEPEIDLTAVRRVLIVAAGKAGATMLEGLLDVLPLPPECAVVGVLMAPEEPVELPSGVTFYPGGHPLPNAASFAGARAALELVGGAGPDDYVFFLISGGASAMMSLPLDEAITLEDMVAFHQALVLSGATIAEINCVRKHFSAVKGGRLGLAAGAAPSLTLLVSDVPERQLDSLGSGPTLPDTSTVEDCLDIIRQYGLAEQFPPAVREFFASHRLVETPKPGELALPYLTMLSAEEMAALACEKALGLGFFTVIDNTCDDWEHWLAAEYLVGRLRELRRQYGPVCIVSAGEVTVAVGPEAGLGGRNQQFALYAATLLTAEDGEVAIFSAGSDGIDGNSPAAGAVVEVATLGSEELRARGLAALAGFAAFPFLDAAGATVRTGPTGNNLRDLRLLLAR